MLIEWDGDIAYRRGLGIVCVCVCNSYSEGRSLGLKDRGGVVLYLTRSCGHIRIKYSVFVESNPLNIKYILNFNLIFISLYDLNFTFISFIILSLFSKLYKLRSTKRSLYYYLLSLITTIKLIILALTFLISIEFIEVLLRTALLYI